MSNRNLVFAGAAMLAVGLFLPVVRMPIVGTLNLLANGGDIVGLILLGLAVTAAFLAFKDRTTDAAWPGAAAAIILALLFARLQGAIGEMQRQALELAGNPFAGLAQAAVGTIQLQWGWLVLALAPALIIYGAVNGRSADSKPFAVHDRPAKAAAGLALAAVLGALAVQFLPGMLARADSGGPPPPDAAEEAADLMGEAAAEVWAGDSQEREYIDRYLRLYELDARYRTSYSGRVPGVTFKIKNEGDRTLNRVKVRVVFYDENDQPIAEHEYTPVLVSEYASGSDTPLRPNYIWQNERNRFYAADRVPSEWASGRVTATITEIDFAPDERP